jgi:hypothetical protein
MDLPIRETDEDLDSEEGVGEETFVPAQAPEAAE